MLELGLKLMLKLGSRSWLMLTSMLKLRVVGVEARVEVKVEVERAHGVFVFFCI